MMAILLVVVECGDQSKLDAIRMSFLEQAFAGCAVVDEAHGHSAQ
jgi:hypothetical protein